MDRNQGDIEMKTSYLILLLAIFFLSTGCTKQIFTKEEKAAVISAPVFPSTGGGGTTGGGTTGGGTTGGGTTSGGTTSGGNDIDPVPPTGLNPPVKLNCSDNKTSLTGYNLMSASNLELRILDLDGSIVCKNTNTSQLRSSILAGTLPITICAQATQSSYKLTLVDPTKQVMIDDLLVGDVSLTRSSNTWNVTSIHLNHNGEYQSTMVTVLYNSNDDNPDDHNCDSRTSPLIVKTENEDLAGIDLTSQENGVWFDILGENSYPRAHAKKKISWITKDSYQFLTKPNSRGAVNGINELFGDNTKGPDGSFADNGYAALAKYDLNQDEVIDASDAVYVDLRLWSDKNFDGKAQRDELRSLADAELIAIDLQFDNSFHEEDQYGNQTKMKSVVKYADGSLKLIFDLWFKYENLRGPASITPTK